MHTPTNDIEAENGTRFYIEPANAISYLAVLASGGALGGVALPA